MKSAHAIPQSLHSLPTNTHGVAEFDADSYGGMSVPALQYFYASNGMKQNASSVMIMGENFQQEGAAEANLDIQSLTGVSVGAQSSYFGFQKYVCVVVARACGRMYMYDKYLHVCYVCMYLGD